MTNVASASHLSLVFQTNDGPVHAHCGVRPAVITGLVPVIQQPFWIAGINPAMTAHPN